MDLFGKRSGQLAAVFRFELDAHGGEVERMVGVVADDDPDGKDAVSDVVDAEEVGAGAGVIGVGGDGDQFFAVLFQHRVGGDVGEGRSFFFCCIRGNGKEQKGGDRDKAAEIHGCGDYHLPCCSRQKIGRVSAGVCVQNDVAL